MPDHGRAVDAIGRGRCPASALCASR
jgi:hypothetical protein